MRKKQEERGRCHAVEPCSLAEACRAVAFELLPELGRQAGDPAEGEGVRDRDALLFAEGRDVELLALEIDGVARIDGKLLGDPGVEIADLRPDTDERGEVDVWIGKKLIGAALPAIAIDDKSPPRTLIRRERESL